MDYFYFLLSALLGVYAVIFLAVVFNIFELILEQKRYEKFILKDEDHISYRLPSVSYEDLRNNEQYFFVFCEKALERENNLEQNAGGQE